jgi:hypothetical protein
MQILHKELTLTNVLFISLLSLSKFLFLFTLKIHKPFIMSKLFFSIFFIFLFSACAKKYTADALPQKQLHFGEGGGFTGKETDYVVLENGQIFIKEPFDKVYKEIGKIKAKEAKVYYKQVAVYQRVAINKPSNAYSFIALQQDSMMHKMIFSAGLKTDSLTQSLLQLHETMKKAMPIQEAKERQLKSENQ